MSEEQSSQLNFSPELVRMIEAILFASSEPVTIRAIQEYLPQETNIEQAIALLIDDYSRRGVNLKKIGDSYGFRTAPDLAYLLNREEAQQRKLSRAALEVLAIIAYHQPVTRAEIEEIRGVETSKGTLDLVMEAGWVKIRGRRKTPGRPVTYGTTQDFLDHFDLSEIRDLPGMEELKGAGLLSSRLPVRFKIPAPNVDPDVLTDDEEALNDIDLVDLGLFSPSSAE